MAYLPPERRPPPSPPGTPYTPRLHPLAMIGFILAILVAIPAVGYGAFLAAALLIGPNWR